MIYRLMDFYDDIYGDHLYDSKRMTDIIKYAKQYDDDTDGECELIAFLYDDESKRYVVDNNEKCVRFSPYTGNIMQDDI